MTYNLGQQIKTITSSLSDATHPGTLVSNVQYGSFGPTSWQLGNGLSAVRAYGSDGRNSGGWLCSGSSQTYCTGGTQRYGYTVGWVGNELHSSCDTVLNQCSGYGYDGLGQLTSRTVNSGTAGNYSYDYDRWGNRWEENVLSGSGPSPQLSFDTSTNQIQTSGYTYDAAGNLISDGLDTYTYDANGNVISVSGADNATYTYDALNRRVQISASGSDSMEFIYNLNGQRVSVWDGPTGSQVQGQVYWGTRPLEFYENGADHFQTQDWEGTERVQTSYNGAVEGTYSSLPYGDGYSASGTDDDAYHYAMLDQDNSSDDHAMYREYSNMTGRWTSPDPHHGSYNIYNPQSMNRYSYVLNNALSMNDPSGLCPPPGREGNAPPCHGDGGLFPNSFDGVDWMNLLEIPVYGPVFENVPDSAGLGSVIWTTFNGKETWFLSTNANEIWKWGQIGVGTDLLMTSSYTSNISNTNWGSGGYFQAAKSVQGSAFMVIPESLKHACDNFCEVRAKACVFATEFTAAITSALPDIWGVATNTAAGSLKEGAEQACGMTYLSCRINFCKDNYVLTH